MRCALDTNIISFLLKGDKDVNASYRKANDSGHVFIIPVVAYYEIKRGLLAVNAYRQMNLFDKLCNLFFVEEMSIAVWDKAAQIHVELKRRGTPLGRDDGDIFIAAHCLTNNYTLVTNNKSDFERIDGLRFIDWKIQ
ncbi:MAG: PIN domain-containing protein [Clostridiales bacterium]|jgi:predicted nucleic acid-binding protein|nr:PIN domain-containing protein [Clostridiales bacterium]